MSDHAALSLFLSSDARRRYAQDVLTALALPPGAVLQFRYTRDYVDPALRDACSTGAVVGRRCVLAYVSQRNAPVQHLVPVRYATVVGIQIVADLYVFRFRLDSYPDLDEWSLDPGRLSEAARNSIDDMMKRNRGVFYNASFRAPRMPFEMEVAEDQGTGWIQIARRLAAVSVFHSCHFVQVGPLRADDGKVLTLDERGEVTLTEGQSVSVRMTYYCDDYDDVPKQIDAETLGDHVRIVSAATLPVSSRFDNVEFRLHAQPVASRSFSRFQVTMTASDPEHDMPTVVDFPVTVRPSRRDLFGRVVASGVGALAVATPAILGPGSPLGLRIALAGAGAALIAVSTTVMTKKR